MSPGTTKYVFGSPLFQKVVVTLANPNSPLIIEAKRNTAVNVYVQRVLWNGIIVSGNSIEYSTLMGGGTLTFEMGPNPVA